MACDKNKRRRSELDMERQHMHLKYRVESERELFQFLLQYIRPQCQCFMQSNFR